MKKSIFAVIALSMSMLVMAPAPVAAQDTLTPARELVRTFRAVCAGVPVNPGDMRISVASLYEEGVARQTRKEFGHSQIRAYFMVKALHPELLSGSDDACQERMIDALIDLGMVGTLLDDVRSDLKSIGRL